MSKPPLNRVPGTPDRKPPLNRVRCTVDVVAGVVPGTPDPEFTRQYFIYSEEWTAATADHALLLTELAGRASAYATYLMLRPDQVNWVKTEWLWQ